MTEAEKNLTNLQKCCGLCVLPWQRVRSTHTALYNSSTTSNSEQSSPITAQPKLRMASEQGMPNSGYITRITNDAREDEMDDNLQLVGSYLGNLKNMALDMNETIVTQTNQIGRITEKADSANTRVNQANKRAENLIRRA
jgi:synaptosomal-associated protein 25